MTCSAKLGRRGLLGLPVVLPWALAACVDTTQPYRGRPGLVGKRLAVPLALRLAVPPPGEALLPDAAALALSEKVAAALQAQDVPAIATAAPLPLDWQVVIVADRDGELIRPRLRLVDADGRLLAVAEAQPIGLRAWAEAAPGTLDALAAETVPRLTGLLLQVEAARKATDPASLTTGPPRVRMAGVRGAPGDGNAALATRMKEFLAGVGFLVQDAADGAAYALSGEVTMTGAGRGLQRVEIQWIVSRRDGEELGRVVQINEVPAGRLNRFWGDIAYVVAEEASDGVKTVIANALAPPGPAPQ